MNGIVTSSGATARSCRSRIDVAASPTFWSSHPFSFKTGKMKAEVERVPARARITA